MKTGAANLTFTPGALLSPVFSPRLESEVFRKSSPRDTRTLRFFSFFNVRASSRDKAIAGDEEARTRKSEVHVRLSLPPFVFPRASSGMLEFARSIRRARVSSRLSSGRIKRLGRLGLEPEGPDDNALRLPSRRCFAARIPPFSLSPSPPSLPIFLYPALFIAHNNLFPYPIRGT